MSRRCVVCCVAALLAVAPVAAQIMSDTALIPILARTTGAGNPPTMWVSDVCIHNPMGSTITVGLKLFPENNANSWDFTVDRTFTIPARNTLLLEDVLGQTFGLTGNVKAGVLVTVDEEIFPTNSDDAMVLVTSRTYNTGDPRGTFGQTIPALNVMFNGDPMPSFITGIRNDAFFRSNLGIVNGSPVTIRVHYRFFRANAQVLATGYKDIPSLSVQQWALSSLGIGTVTGPISADFWLDPSSVTPNPCDDEVWSNQFAAYISKVDGNPTGTGDPEFLLAVPVLIPPPDQRCPDN